MDITSYCHHDGVKQKAVAEDQVENINMHKFNNTPQASGGSKRSSKWKLNMLRQGEWKQCSRPSGRGTGGLRTLIAINAGGKEGGRHPSTTQQGAEEGQTKARANRSREIRK